LKGPLAPYIPHPIHLSDHLGSQPKPPSLTSTPILCFSPLGLFNQASAWLNLAYQPSQFLDLYGQADGLASLTLLVKS